jgi:small basic protein
MFIYPFKKEGKMKIGVKTTEFWLTLVNGVVVALCNALNVPPDVKEHITALALKIVGAYIASRTVVKAASGGEVKRGILTSEFWFTLLVEVVIAAMQAYKVPLDVQNAIVNLLLAYIASRTTVKVAESIKVKVEQDFKS